MKVAPADLPRILGSVLREVDELLRSLAIPHALIGGLAVGIYTQARATKDVDLAVTADAEAASRAVAAMRARGFDARAHGVPGPGGVVRFSRTDADGLVRWVDFLFAGTAFEERAVARARVEQVLGAAIAVVTVEDLLVYKLIAGRPQDVADAVALVRERGPLLDRAYLEVTCDAWELKGDLARIEALAAQVT